VAEIVGLNNNLDSHNKSSTLAEVPLTFHGGSIFSDADNTVVHGGTFNATSIGTFILQGENSLFDFSQRQ